MGIKNYAEVTLKLSSSNVNCDSNDENNFPHKLILTNTQVSKLCKAFVNGSSANIKLSKTQLFRTMTKNGLPLIGNILKLLIKSALMLLD